jgi:DNA polymerase-3 subunit epsilon
MAQRYIAFDVETPNYANNRMSAIGITVVDGGEIVEDFYTLVNPEARFDDFNVQLTGITPAMVAGKPAFPALWQRIQPLMGSGVLVAHSATFDLGVLSKCLGDYHIPWQPSAPYVCTCQMGRACYPELANHKLNTLCAYLDLSLDHHNAGSDSRACAELLLDYMRHGLSPARFQRHYDLTRYAARSL